MDKKTRKEINIALFTKKLIQDTKFTRQNILVVNEYYDKLLATNISSMFTDNLRYCVNNKIYLKNDSEISFIDAHDIDAGHTRGYIFDKIYLYDINLNPEQMDTIVPSLRSSNNKQPISINPVVKKIITTPTGHIGIIDGDFGKLEFLSLGDYGKEKNIKADFLGYTKEIHGVEHSELLPLEDKWVITISTQYGCSMDCTFCDVPKVGKGLNASINDLINQVEIARAIHPEVSHGRINLHYARMGEPTFNPNVIKASYYLRGQLTPDFKFHPVVSTMMPQSNNKLKQFLRDWLDYKNFSNGDAGLQLSINTTDEQARKEMFSNNAMLLEDISNIFYDLLAHEEFKGRKIALNFALTGHPIDAKRLRELFSPRYFMCKITPMHQTKTCQENNFNHNGYDSYEIYKPIEEALKAEGFDVLVFVPSLEEDESAITCGNAILSQNND